MPEFWSISFHKASVSSLAANLHQNCTCFLSSDHKRFRCQVVSRMSWRLMRKTDTERHRERERERVCVKEKEREMNLLILCCCFQRGLCCLGELANPSLVLWFKILNLFSMLSNHG
jgi:hypothetical protein